MKQRVAIARWMAMEPDIMLMDEPFASLDALTRRPMQDELLQLWHETKFTVLFVTHSIAEAIRSATAFYCCRPTRAKSRPKFATTTRSLKFDRRRRCEPRRTNPRYSLHAGSGRRHRINEPRITIHPSAKETSCPDAEDAELKLFFPAALEQRDVPKDCLVIILGVIWEAYASYVDNSLFFQAQRDVKTLIKASTERCPAGEILLQDSLDRLRLRHGDCCRHDSTRDQHRSAQISSKRSPQCSIPCRLSPYYRLRLSGSVSALAVSFSYLSIRCIWAVSLNTHSGFLGVSQTLRMVGRNYGLRGIRMYADPRPGGVSFDLTGLKIGWAVADAHRRRTGVRRLVGPRRNRLVHLRKPQHAGYLLRCSPAC